MGDGLGELKKIDGLILKVCSDLSWVWGKLRFEDGQKSRLGTRGWRWQTEQGRVILTQMGASEKDAGMIELRGENGWVLTWSRWTGVTLYKRKGNKFAVEAAAIYPNETLEGERRLYKKVKEIRGLLELLVEMPTEVRSRLG